MKPQKLMDQVRTVIRYSNCTGVIGHKDLNTTMIYTHVLHSGGFAVKSPLDNSVSSFMST